MILRFPEGETQAVHVTVNVDGHFEISGPVDPSKTDVDVGLTVEVQARGGACFDVLRMVAPSPFTHWQWELSKVAVRSVAFERLCEDLDREGALWRCRADGQLQVHLLRTSDHPLLRVLQEISACTTG